MIRIEGIGELKRRLEPAVERVDGFDWRRIEKDLDQQGNAIMEQLLSPKECRAIADLYAKDDIFRSRFTQTIVATGDHEARSQAFNIPLPRRRQRLVEIIDR